MRIFPRRLNTRLVLLVSCILLATGVTSGWVTARKQSNTLLATMRGNSAIMARSFSENAAHYLVLQDYAALESFLFKSAELPDIAQLQVCEPDGVVIGNVERIPGMKPRAIPDIARIAPPLTPAPAIIDEENRLVIWQPIEAGNLLGWIKATYSMATIQTAQRATWENSILLALFWVACSIVLLLLVLRPTVQAIGGLTTFARRLNERKGDQMVVAHRAAEIEELGASLNYASSRLFSTEQQLLREREHLRVTLRSIHDGVIAADADGAVVFMNRSSEELTGWSAAEATGRKVDEIFRLRPLHEFFRGLHSSATGGGSGVELDPEAVLVTKDGMERSLAGSAAPIRDDGGNVSGMVIVFRDITERKMAEEALRTERDNVVRIFEAMTDGVYIVNQHNDIHYVNPVLIKEFGPYEGRKCYEYFHERTEACPWCKNEDVFAGKTVRWEWHSSKHGRTYDLVDTPLLNPDGSVYKLEIFRDITERKRAEEALHKRESELSESQRLAHIGSWDWDARKDAIWWSDEYYRIYGLDPNQPAPNYIEHLKAYTAESAERLDAAVKRAMETGEPYEVDLELAHPTASTRWIVARGEVKRDANGKTWGLRGTAQNITERKEAEEALHRINRELRAISNCNEVLVRVEDEQTLLNEICRIICDEAGYRMAWVGYAENDAARTVRTAARAGVEDGYLADASITWADRPRGHGPTGIAIRTGKTDSIQDFTTEPKAAPWRDSALQRGYRSSIALPLKDESKSTFGTLTLYSTEVNAFTPDEIRLLEELAGDLAYGIMVLRARIERKRAEDSLLEREAFIRNILNSVDEGFIVVNRQYRILSANRAFCSMMKLTEDRVVGRMCYEVSHRSARPCFEAGEDCAVKRTFETGTSHNVTHAHTEASGAKHYVELKSYPIVDSSGKVASVIETVSDITEKRKLEEQLRQAQKMEAVGTLAGGVAHDFNNILTAIIGYGSIVKMKMKPDDPQRASIDAILSSSERAAHLTQGLLAFSRKQIINPKPVDVNSIITSVEKLLRRLIGEDVELSTVLAGRGLMIMADSGQVEQVLMNLATNARDAMPDGGILTITTQECELNEDFVAMHGFGKPGRYALISVSDTGLGMDEQTREKIFEPFYTTKELGKGTGLGLAIVYGIVKQHSGNIDVYSEPAKGTTFKIYLPLIAAQAEEMRVETAQQPRGGTETILLAEDDREVRNLTTTILSEFGYRVIEAVDGQEALDKFAVSAKEIDLLVLDVIMPRKSGKEVYDAVKAARPDIGVLFISGYTADIIHKKGIFEEDLHFLCKPVIPFELLRTIRDILDHKEQQPG